MTPPLDIRRIAEEAAIESWSTSDEDMAIRIEAAIKEGIRAFAQRELVRLL